MMLPIRQIFSWIYTMIFRNRSLAVDYLDIGNAFTNRQEPA